VIADYHETAQNLWMNISTMANLSVITYGLISEYASPRVILAQRTRRLRELI
jgi:hypothetical protein